MKNSLIKLPEMRSELLDYLYDLTQIQVDQEAPSAAEDLEYVIHFLFDDTSLALQPNDYIDLILTSNEEASAIKKMGELIDNYLKATSPGNSPIRFVEGKEWELLKDAAQAALRVINSSSG